MATDMEASLRRIIKDLPPSTELMTYYHKKIAEFERAEREHFNMQDAYKSVVSQASALQVELQAKNEEISRLKSGLESLQSKFDTQSRRVVKFTAQVDRFRIQEYEHRRKILLLLRMCGKSDAEITQLITQEARSDDDSAAELMLSPAFRQYQRCASGARKSLKPTYQTLQLQVASYEQQQSDVEASLQCQVDELRQQMSMASEELSELHADCKQKMVDMSQAVQSKLKVDRASVECNATLVAQLRAAECQWNKDRERLCRRIQVLENTLLLSAESTSNSQHIPSETSTAHSTQVAKLQRQLAESRNECTKLRLDSAENVQRLTLVTEQAKRDKQRQSKRVKTLTEQLQNLSKRFEQSEKRRKDEAAGYRADVELMQKAQKGLKSQLVQTAISKNKEYEYIRKIGRYETQIEELTTAMKRSGDWIN